MTSQTGRFNGTPRTAVVYWSDGTTSTLVILKKFRVDNDTYCVQFPDYSWEEIAIVNKVEWK